MADLFRMIGSGPVFLMRFLLEKFKLNDPVSG